MNAIFRGAGDAAFAMRVLWLGNALNIVLAPVSSSHRPRSPSGRDWRGRGHEHRSRHGLLYQVYLLTGRKSKIAVTRETLRYRPRRHWTRASNVRFRHLQILISTASYVGIVRIISTFGSIPLAGYTIGIRIIMFALLPSFGVEQCGRDAGRTESRRGSSRSRGAIVWRACIYNAVLLGAVGLIFVAFAPWLVGIFTPDVAVRSFGVGCLRIVSAGFLFYAFGMVLSQSFNGAGDTLTPR